MAKYHLCETFLNSVAKPGRAATSKLLHKINLWSNFQSPVRPGFATEFKNISHKCYLVIILTCLRESGDSKKIGEAYCIVMVAFFGIYSKILREGQALSLFWLNVSRTTARMVGSFSSSGFIVNSQSHKANKVAIVCDNGSEDRSSSQTKMVCSYWISWIESLVEHGATTQLMKNRFMHRYTFLCKYS